MKRRWSTYAGAMYRTAKRAARRGAGYVLKYGPGLAAGVASQQGFPFSMTMTKSKNTSGIGVTSQYDRRLQYRRRPAPRRLKRKLRKFYKRWKSQLLKTLGSNIAIKNEETTIGLTGTGTNQAVGAFHLYGTSGIDIGAIERGGGDLNDIFSGDSRVNTGESKLLFSTGILDITMYANEFNGENPTVKAEVDIYEVLYTDETKESSLTACINTSRTQTETIPGFVSELNLSTRGVSLFDFPALTQQVGMKILKKTKVFLSPGNFTTYQIRNTKNVYVSKEDITDSDGFVKPWTTRGLVVIMKPVTGAALEDININFGITRRYNYKVLEGMKKYDGFIP